MNKLSDNKGVWIGIAMVGILAVAGLMGGDDGLPGMPGTPGTPGTPGNLAGGVGFQTGPNYACPGGVCTYSYSQSMTLATNTLCAALSPAGTSTVVSAIATIAEGTTTASTLVWGRGNHSNATTTALLNSMALAANQKGTYNFASSTVLAPSTWVTLSQQGGVGTMSNTGSCNITFEATNS